MLHLWILLALSLNQVLQVTSRGGSPEGGNPSDANNERYYNHSGRITGSSCDFTTVNRLNAQLYPNLQSLVTTPFFRYVKVNLNKNCPYWKEQGQCMMRDCAVELMKEDEIQEMEFMWNKSNLGDVRYPHSGSDISFFKNCEHTDRDFCVIDDEVNNDGNYIDLQDNPERYTGYTGEPSHRIWRAIYEENCFSIPNLKTNKNIAKLRQSADRAGLTLLAEKEPETCLEKLVFYRILSGLHSSISMHICSQYLNKTTGVWGPNLNCFKERIGPHRDRVENLYFDYLILLRAITKMSSYLTEYDVCTGNPTEDDLVKKLLGEVITTTQSCPSTFDEKRMFNGPQAMVLKEEFRQRFKNISRIMDCVSCQKCRLWGKTQITGVGTALKVLFSYDDSSFSDSWTPKKPLLSRVELVALINTLNRFSESIQDLEMFKKLWKKEKELTKENAELLQPNLKNEMKGDLENIGKGEGKEKVKEGGDRLDKKSKSMRKKGEGTVKKKKNWLDEFELTDDIKRWVTVVAMIPFFIGFYCSILGKRSDQESAVERMKNENKQLRQQENRRKASLVEPKSFGKDEKMRAGVEVRAKKKETPRPRSVQSWLLKTSKHQTSNSSLGGGDADDELDTDECSSHSRSPSWNARLSSLQAEGINGDKGEGEVGIGEDDSEDTDAELDRYFNHRPNGSGAGGAGMDTDADRGYIEEDGMDASASEYISGSLERNGNGVATWREGGAFEKTKKRNGRKG